MTVAAYVEQLRREQPARRGLSAQSRAFLFSTIALAAAISIVASTSSSWGRVRWTDFAVLVVAGAVAQLFAAHIAGNQLFHTGLAFTVAAALLLPPALVVAVCVAQHLPEWLRQRYRWYIQTFNIANFVVSGLTAWAVRREMAGLGLHFSVKPATSSVVVAASAGAAFVLVNHVLLAQMLKLSRGHDLRSTGLFSVDGLITDLVLAGTGIAIAFALLREPALAPVTALPLVLIHRALIVPTLREQAFRDHRTGLLNTRGIEKVADEELARARRFGRPLSVLVCDLDGMRELNNRYGHLVGDAALVAMADALRAKLRNFDLCARFGGDEFLVVLPETELEEACAVGQRVAAQLMRSRLAVADVDPLAVRVSIGAATREESDTSLHELIARADAAMYDAKPMGEAPAVALA